MVEIESIYISESKRARVFQGGNDLIRPLRVFELMGYFVTLLYIPRAREGLILPRSNLHGFSRIVKRTMSIDSVYHLTLFIKR